MVTTQQRKVTRTERLMKTPMIVGAKPKGKGYQVTIPKEAAEQLGLKGHEQVAVWLDKKNRTVIYELIS